MSQVMQHLIRLTAKEDGGLPELAQIRSAVAREWSNDRRQEANDRFYQALRAHYSVEIRLPRRSVDGQSLAVGSR